MSDRPDPAGLTAHLSRLDKDGYTVAACVIAPDLLHIQGLADEVAAQPCWSLAAITVSPDGVRVAERFGMKRAGTFSAGGFDAAVFTSRRRLPA